MLLDGGAVSATSRSGKKPRPTGWIICPPKAA